MKKQSLFLISFLLLLALAACRPAQRAYKEELFAMNTLISLDIYTENPKFSLQPYSRILYDLEEKYSRHQKNTMLFQVNERAHQNPYPIDEEWIYLLKKSADFYTLSQHKFDVSIGPLLDIWDVTGPKKSPPEDDQIERAKQKVCFESIVIDEKLKTIQMPPGMILDLGAILKGYATDLLVSQLKRDKVPSALLNLGGNVYAHGLKEGKAPWRIGIKNPHLGATGFVGVLSVSDKAVITSGLYERYFIWQDRIYHHILDPQTGYPADNQLLSVTIVSSSGIDADILSTACFLLGLEEGFKLMENFEDSGAIFITKNNEVYISPNLEPFWQLTDKDFQSFYGNN